MFRCDDDQPCERDTGLDERRRIGCMRRGDPDLPTAGARQSRERGQQHAHFADAMPSDENLGQRTGWPATPWQLAIQPWKPGGDTRRAHRCERIAPPQGGMFEEFREGRHGDGYTAGVQ